MDKKWNMGLLGLGEGRSVMSATLNSPLWNLKTICDLNEELCRSRCQEFDFHHYTTDYNEMLQDPDIDVIGIYTPDQLHAAHIKMALKAGKHVMCTKPLMVDLKDAGELLALQRETGKVVFIGQSSRYFEPAKQQHLDYLAGKHGELASLETHYISDSRWFLERAWSHSKGFSWMFNFMIHAVDLAAWYLPDIEDVYGVGVTSQNTKDFGLSVPDALRFILKDKNGVCAAVSGVYAEPTLGSEVEQSISCTLRGTKGISRAGYPHLKYYTNFEPIQHTATLHDYSDKKDYYFRFEGLTHHAGEYQNYLEELANCLNQGRTPKPDLTEGVHTIAIMKAMERCLETGELVHVSDILKENHIELGA